MMDTESECYWFFYQFVWYQSCYIIPHKAINFNGKRFFLKKCVGTEWRSVTDPNDTDDHNASIEMKLERFEIEEIRKEETIRIEDKVINEMEIRKSISDEPYDMFSFALSPFALKEISNSFLANQQCEIIRAELLLLEFGLTAFNILLKTNCDASNENFVIELEKRIRNLKDALIPAFLDVFESLKRLGVIVYLKEVPRSFFEKEGAITKGLRFDCFLFVLDQDDETLNKIISVHRLSSYPIVIDDIKIHTGWYLHAVRMPSHTEVTQYFKRKSSGMEMVWKADLIHLGAFVGASATADALRIITQDILNKNLGIEKSAVRSLIMQGRQVIGYCHAMKGSLSSSGGGFFELLNKDAEVASESQHFEEAVINVLRGFDGLEQERMGRVDRVIQVLLLMLASVTLVSVVKDGVDFLSTTIWPHNVFWKETTCALIVILLVIVLMLLYVGRKIFRREQ